MKITEINKIERRFNLELVERELQAIEDSLHENKRKTTTGETLEDKLCDYMMDHGIKRWRP